MRPRRAISPLKVYGASKARTISTVSLRSQPNMGAYSVKHVPAQAELQIIGYRTHEPWVECMVMLED